VTDDRRLGYATGATGWCAVLLLSPAWLAWATLAGAGMVAGRWFWRRGRASRRFGLACTAGVLVLLVVTVDARPDSVDRLSTGSVRALIVERFGSGWLGREMVCIARRESELRPRAVNWRDVHADGSRGSFGLFQIGRLHAHYVAGEWRRLLNPAVNVRVAWQLYRTDGLNPWGGGC
jgi:hypothetical protein